MNVVIFILAAGLKSKAQSEFTLHMEQTSLTLKRCDNSAEAWNWCHHHHTTFSLMQELRHEDLTDSYQNLLLGMNLVD